MSKSKKVIKRKMVFVSGNFNVLHPGHLRLLRFAKECGDYLIIGVKSDRVSGKNSYVSESLRLEGILSNNWVNEAMIIDDPVKDVINRLRPDIVVKGSEFQALDNPEEKVLNSYGGKLIFSSGESIFSSLDILRKEIYESRISIKLPSNYLQRHSIKIKKIIDLIQIFKTKKVCVIGDLIVDEYITCEALGMSQEDATIVVTPVDSVKFLGGAGIVAAHGSGMEANMTLLSLKGNDSNGLFAEKLLKEAGVNAHLISDENRPTTLKQRFRSKGKSLLRVSHLHQSTITLSQQKELLDRLHSIIDDIDLIVFSDFNYGCLPQVLVDKIIDIAKSKNIILTADSQSSSQIGSVSRFHDMDLITPTEHETRICLNNNEDGLVIIAEKLRQKSLSKNILLKLGEEGMLVHNTQMQTDRIEALNKSSKDPSGAGDSLLIAASLALTSGGNIWESSFLGSLAAAIQVGRVGNTPLTAEELILELE